jgi:hypothetical protein
LARGVRQVLVQWKGESAASATWEDVEPFCAKYPAFQLEDELVLEGGEMSWSSAHTPDATGPVMCAVTRSVRSARYPIDIRLLEIENRDSFLLKSP